MHSWLRGPSRIPKDALDYDTGHGLQFGHNVQFLHRTTSDFFLENEQARQYLQEHTTDNFDPYSSYVKAELGTLILFTMSEKGLELYSEEETEIHEDWHKSSSFIGAYVRYVMQAAAELEARRGRACIAQIDQIDKIITDLYKRYDNRTPPLHWCARWHNESSVVADESGNITHREPRDRVDLEQEYSAIAPFRPVEFLGLTATYGLSSFLQQKIRSGLSPFHAQTPSYLLCCVVLRYHEASEYEERSIDIVCFLLDNGADPNFVAFGSTIWRYMLGQMWEFNTGGRGLRLKLPLERAWMKVIMALLAKNIDVHETVKVWRGNVYGSVYDHVYPRLFTKLYQVLKPEKSISFSKPTEFEIYLMIQASASEVLENFVDGMPGFEEIKKILVARETRSESYVSDVAVSFYDGSPYETYDLSMLRSNKFLGAFASEFGISHEGVRRIDCSEALTAFKKVFDAHEADSEDEVEDDDSIYHSLPSTPKSDHESDQDIIDQTV